MARDPAATVRAALAVANDSRAAEGVRVAALNRANALIERHGLEPGGFDFPGQAKAAPTIRVRFFEYDGAGGEELAKAMAEAFSGSWGRSAHAQAAEFESARPKFSTGVAAADWLYAAGRPVYDTQEDDESRWYVPARATTMTDAELIRYAEGLAGG